MLSIPAFFLAAGLALTPVVQATLGTCPADLACCSKSPARRSIFPRTDCPAGANECCKTTSKVVIPNPGTKTLQCGKSTEATGTLAIKVEPCNTDATKQCLHFNYGANTDGINYKDVHLGLYTSALTAFIPPGQLNANGYCTLTGGGITADCWVPLGDISSKYFGGSADLCTKQLYVVAHVSYPDSGLVNGNTCYGQGQDVPGNNWAQAFLVTFECVDQCSEKCCCPTTSPPDVWCPRGTAYGYVPGAPTLNSITPLPATCKHWVKLPFPLSRFRKANAHPS